MGRRRPLWAAAAAGSTAEMAMVVEVVCVSLDGLLDLWLRGGAVFVAVAATLFCGERAAVIFKKGGSPHPRKMQGVYQFPRTLYKAQQAIKKTVVNCGNVASSSYPNKIPGKWDSWC